MTAYPQHAVPVGHTAPVPRRIRAVLAGEVVLDTVRASYVWERQPYPQFAIPRADVRPGVLDGSALRLGAVHRPDAVTVPRQPELADTVRLRWDALDAWFEEDEEVFVHPRSPYVRVDALRSTRHVRIALGGVTLAESRAPVLLFETGLPTRYYLDRADVDLRHLVPSGRVTACPYKGRTTGYWSVRVGQTTLPDVAWCYHFPTAALAVTAGLIAFDTADLDLTVTP